MNKTCSRCEKTVYPVEELKCLDKVWHKGCFKCQECGMTLNMKNYKGYGKLPYCEAHVPKAKHTTMAETPELKRIAENTKLQSNVNYHADFEKSKGKFTPVADDPETLRIKANTKIISNVAYHGDLAKKAAMEKQRTLNENGEIVDQPDNYQSQIDSYATEMLPPPPQQYSKPDHSNQQQYSKPDHSNQHQYRPEYSNSKYTQQPNINLTSYPTQQKIVYEDQSTHYNAGMTYSQGYQAQQSYQQQQAQQKIGKIADYDPVTDGPRSQPYMQRQSATLIYNSSENSRGAHQQHNQHPRRIGNVADMDPMAAHESYVSAHQQQQRRPPPQASQKVYVAMYDYDANDSDEVSFREGDLISNVSSIDEGWMTGQVLRTGHTGMLPANYVELAK